MGDPFLEKLLLEACLEAHADRRSSSAYRTWAWPASPAPLVRWVAAAGVGIEIDLQHVPQRETGMTPYEIMLSESQERMLLVAQKGPRR